MLLSRSFLWVVPVFPLLARAVISWCGPGDQSRLSRCCFYKTNSQNSIVAEIACYMEAGLGEAGVLVETHFLILFYFSGGRHRLVLNAQALRVAFLISQTKLVPAYLASFLSKFCLLRSQNPCRTKWILPLYWAGCAVKSRGSSHHLHVPWHTGSNHSSLAECLVKKGRQLGNSVFWLKMSTLCF